MIVYFNGQYVDKTEVAISPDDRGFLFADGVYDVIQVYGGCLFRGGEHFARLAFGLRELRIEGVTAEELEPVACRLLNENDLRQAPALIYLQVTRGTAPRSHRFPPRGTPPTVYVEAKPFSPPLEVRRTGAAALLVADERWSRCDIKTISLLPNTLAHQRACEAGAFEAVFCRDGQVHEGSHSSILFVKEEVLIAPPLTNRTLPSVTRQVVLELAHAEPITTEIRPCLEGEVFSFDEVMMLGTAVEIVPITSLNGRRIGAGMPGPITLKLQAAFRRLTAEFQRVSVTS